MFDLAVERIRYSRRIKIGIYEEVEIFAEFKL